MDVIIWGGFAAVAIMGILNKDEIKIASDEQHLFYGFILFIVALAFFTFTGIELLMLRKGSLQDGKGAYLKGKYHMPEREVKHFENHPFLYLYYIIVTFFLTNTITHMLGLHYLLLGKFNRLIKQLFYFVSVIGWVHIIVTYIDELRMVANDIRNLYAYQKTLNVEKKAL